MTTPINHDNESSFDGAMSMSLPLPPNSQLLNHTTNVNAVRTALSPDDPWSRINTRLEHDQAPVSDSESPAPAHAFAPHALQSYHPQGLEDNLATIESRLCLPTHASYSSPPSPPTSLPWAAASSATAPSTESRSICCRQCGVQFTGAYQRGNLARHVRHKHTAVKGGLYTCPADGCYKDFARQDARLKHARKHHPGLYPEPVQKKQGHERDLMTSQPIDDGSALSYYPRSSPRSIQSTPSHQRHLAEAPLGGGYTTLPLSLSPDGAQSRQPSSRLVTGMRPWSSSNNKDGGLTATSSLDFNIGQWLPTSPQTSVYPVFHQPRARHVDTSVVTPLHNPPLPSASNKYNVAGMSPSSLYDTANSTLLSPFATGSDYRRTSSSSQALHVAPRRYRMSSTTKSLRDDWAQPGDQAGVTTSTIDPSLLITPHSDNGQEEDRLRQLLFLDRS
ncbi:uncharacterized protein K460DRAFT_400389 [Cucurbitaria berberidis CBS 394.84]|uniref:C2H2-type domain-containing protein n=1 Tax=Cucurbitaria berberidis CBS 394.84 TaxID=1168544 RepID=A0A9P4GRX4_9PLEO|nr:uncharacterized protein K460DRAFT_400389 [Cucurbitaria berberidis CBS 394.84]KAF1850321.1 hypothetical protein K460DRAFT_400389 [Cucurbitaria berberidis CBS 394.84]